MKVLVLVAIYPNNEGSFPLMYVHVRNKEYVRQGIEVTVLNFSCDKDYIYDGISVISLNTYRNGKFHFDKAICHAANLKYHYIFLKKYDNRFNEIIFFFHGHEILYVNQEYPEPFYYIARHRFIRKSVQNIYDKFKMIIWRNYFTRRIDKCVFIFVSKWIYKKFLINIGLDQKFLVNKTHIIHNSVGKAFEENDYDRKAEKKYDFITVRANFDDPKYGVDLVNNLAIKNPKFKFCLIGKGKYFDYYPKAENLTWINENLDHERMLGYLNSARVGLLLTREDTQGVSTCEFSAFGIPTITSNIDVCNEVFADVSNIIMIPNEDSMDLNRIFEQATQLYEIKVDKFYQMYTLDKEIDVVKRIP